MCKTKSQEEYLGYTSKLMTEWKDDHCEVKKTKYMYSGGQRLGRIWEKKDPKSEVMNLIIILLPLLIAVVSRGFTSLSHYNQPVASSPSVDHTEVMQSITTSSPKPFNKMDGDRKTQVNPTTSVGLEFQADGGAKEEQVASADESEEKASGPVYTATETTENDDHLGEADAAGSETNVAVLKQRMNDADAEKDRLFRAVMDYFDASDLLRGAYKKGEISRDRYNEQHQKIDDEYMVNSKALARARNIHDKYFHAYYAAIGIPCTPSRDSQVANKQ